MKYIKIKVLLLVCFVAFSSLSAQDIEFGLKGGMNLSSMSIPDADDSNILPGFHAGVFTRVPIANSNFAIQPELLYSAKGLKAMHSELSESETTYQLYYVDLPVNLIYNLAPDFYFQGGPYLGLLMNANASSESDLLIDQPIDKQSFNKLDVGVGAGLGFSLNKIDIGFNYNFGLIRQQ